MNNTPIEVLPQEKYMGSCRGAHYVSNRYDHTVKKFKLNGKGERVEINRGQSGYSFVCSFTNTEKGVESYRAFVKQFPYIMFVKIHRNIGKRVDGNGNPHKNGWCGAKFSTHFDCYNRTAGNNNNLGLM